MTAPSNWKRLNEKENSSKPYIWIHKPTDKTFTIKGFRKNLQGGADQANTEEADYYIAEFNGRQIDSGKNQDQLKSDAENWLRKNPPS